MSVRVVQVDESQKDEPGVEKATVTTVSGRSIETYVRTERVDDFDGKTTDNVVEIQMLIPVEDEDSEDPNDLYIYNRAVIDLGEASLIKYLKAIAPFADKARLPHQPAESAPATSGGRSTKVTEWNRRAKEYLRKQGHDVKDRGRLPVHLEEIYVANNPEDPKP